MYLLRVPSVSSRYFNKIERTSYLGKKPALSLEIFSRLRTYLPLCRTLYVTSYRFCGASRHLLVYYFS